MIFTPEYVVAGLRFVQQTQQQKYQDMELALRTQGRNATADAELRKLKTRMNVISGLIFSFDAEGKVQHHHEIAYMHLHRDASH